MMIQLNFTEREALLQTLPQKLKLSYEARTHHKKDADCNDDDTYISIIPKGRRCLLWFTEWANQPVCAILEIKNPLATALTDIYGNIAIYTACFDPSLTQGDTVFGGVLFSNNPKKQSKLCNFFAITVVHFFKGRQIFFNDVVLQHTITHIMFSTAMIKQVGITTHGLIIGLPILCRTPSEASAIVKTNNLPYEVYGLQYRKNGSSKIELSIWNDNHHSELYQTPPQTNEQEQEQKQTQVKDQVKDQTQVQDQTQNQTQVKYQIQVQTHVQNQDQEKEDPKNITKIAYFMVKPDVQNDIYHLYVRKDKTIDSELEYYSVAHVPSYKISVSLNRIFRNIKENDNLDALEESEDEDDFENTNADKYVDLTQEFVMRCICSEKFKRWIPSALVNSSMCKNKSIVITKQEINDLDTHWFVDKRKYFKQYADPQNQHNQHNQRNQHNHHHNHNHNHTQRNNHKQPHNNNPHHNPHHNQKVFIRKNQIYRQK